MTIRFKGHNYKTQFYSKLTKGYCQWFGHGDNCCDYWTPIDSPKAQRALIMDDELGLNHPNPKQYKVEEA